MSAALRVSLFLPFLVGNACAESKKVCSGGGVEGEIVMLTLMRGTLPCPVSSKRPRDRHQTHDDIPPIPPSVGPRIRKETPPLCQIRLHFPLRFDPCLLLFLFLSPRTRPLRLPIRNTATFPFLFPHSFFFPIFQTVPAMLKSLISCRTCSTRPSRWPWAYCSLVSASRYCWTCAMRE